MTDAREIIARAAEDIVIQSGGVTYDEFASAFEKSLNAAGFRILGPDEVSAIAEECARIAGIAAKENDTGSGFDSHAAYTTARRIESDIRTRFGRPA